MGQVPDGAIEDTSVFDAWQTLMHWLSEYELPSSPTVERLSDGVNDGDIIGEIFEPAERTGPMVIRQQPTQSDCRILAALLTTYADNVIDLAAASFASSHQPARPS